MSSARDFSDISDQLGFTSLMKAAQAASLPNSNLLVSQDQNACDFVAREVAKIVLDVEEEDNCIDFFNIYPFGVMRQISVDQIRGLRDAIYLSPRVGEKKFVLLSCAECMNGAAANAFLKTLEEPPADTIIFLTTSQLYRLPATIIGRCAVTRLQGKNENLISEDFENWLSNYSCWLLSVFTTSGTEKLHCIMKMYLLLSQIESITQNLARAHAEADMKRKLYMQFLFSIETHTAEFFRKNLTFIKVFPRAVASLEQQARLITLNANFMACLEAFFMEIFQLSVSFV